MPLSPLWRNIMADFSDPEHNEYDDDEYKNYPDPKKFNKEFQFDWASWELWLQQAIQDIVDDGDGVWVVGGYDNKEYNDESNSPVIDSETEEMIKEKLIYFGQNHYGEGIWKTKYFKHNYFENFYKNHLMAHAAHILKQPSYYRGLYDILN